MIEPIEFADIAREHDLAVLYSLEIERRIVQKRRLTSEQREQAYDQLRLMAIQYEKYPVAKWKDSAELQSIFKAAFEENPEHAASLRAKNWNRSMWLP